MFKLMKNICWESIKVKHLHKLQKFNIVYNDENIKSKIN